LRRSGVSLWLKFIGCDASRCIAYWHTKIPQSRVGPCLGMSVACLHIAFDMNGECHAGCGCDLGMGYGNRSQDTCLSSNSTFSKSLGKPTSLPICCLTHFANCTIWLVRSPCPNRNHIWDCSEQSQNIYIYSHLHGHAYLHGVIADNDLQPHIYHQCKSVTECQVHWHKDVSVAMPRKAIQVSQLVIRLIKPAFKSIKVVHSFASRCLIIPAVNLISKVMVILQL